jgi:hypothetical protein
VSAELVNLEVHFEYRDGGPDVIGPVAWPWALPRQGDQITFGTPRRRMTVDCVRFDLGASQVVIVCDAWP